jgi:alkylation response protein AidB-like acyl-CoA dehydrogenase
MHMSNSQYQPPLEDIKFQLEAFGYNEVAALENFETYDLETAMECLEGAADVLMNSWLTVNKKGDEIGVSFNPEDKTVTLPEGFQEVYDEYKESGYMAMKYPEEFGGGGAPHMLSIMLGEMEIATNKSLSMCPGLSHGLIAALKAYGSDEQKETWVPNLVSGEWSGTMCLTEPQSGTDLGLVNTTATPNGDSFILNGSKIWITFGEHDLTENIIHLVLARLPGAPKGIKGISAFIVPKFTLDGRRNGVYCTGLDHKMGIHASPTCVISMEDAEGYLVGSPHKGMRAMFVMMNEARLSVGIEGLSLSDAAYQEALAFAKERRQGRSLNPKRNDTSADADRIIVHPDVRRLLLKQKSTIEAMRGVGSFISKHIDLSHHHPDEKQREISDDMVALLTPVVKSFFTEIGFLNTSDAMQLCGGIGYTSEIPIEQHMRDVRIAMIYEGTNHVQAMDLVGRKLMMGGGRLIKRFGKNLEILLTECAADERLLEFVVPTKEAADTLTKMTMHMAQQGMADQEAAMAMASEYLNVFGYVTFAFSWLTQCKFAVTRDDALAKTKLKTARFFYKHVLPGIESHKTIMLQGKEAIMAFEDDEF